jgi:hypothetical protein
MKCPNEKCDHEFDIDDFGQPFQDIIVACPKCHAKVEACWDEQLTDDGDEYPFVSELWLVKQE